MSFTISYENPPCNGQDLLNNTSPAFIGSQNNNFTVSQSMTGLSSSGLVSSSAGLTVSSGIISLPNASISDYALSSNIPLKDASNIFSQQIVGSISGNATSASTVTITDDNVNATNYLVFADNNTGNLGLKVDKTTNPLSYNPLTGVLNSTNFTGSLTGTASSASTITIVDDNVNATNYLVFTNNNTGNLGLKVDKTTNPLSYNPLTGVLNSTNFTGSLSGNSSSSTNSNNTLTGTSNTAIINLVGGVTKALTYQQLFMGNTLPLTYDTLNGLLTTQSLSYKEILRQSQSPASGSTLNFILGSLIIDTSTTASAFIFPIYTASNNGAEIVIQKTSATNHNCVLTAGVGNQIAAINNNALGGTFTMTNNIYQQSFRFINPNWYPF